jgi:hypothetical protein
MIKNKFLLIPVLIFILSILIDRIIMLEPIQIYFTKTVSEINYFHKDYLFEELKIYLNKTDRKKVLVYFGNSRGLLFNNKYIQKHYPNWILFNFSVPGGTPDYFNFWLERFKEQNVKPDFVLIDTAIEAYNLNPRIKIDEVLINGLDFKFILSNYDRYSAKEITNFIAKKLFKTYQYRPKIDTILQRLKNHSAIAVNYKAWRKKITEQLIQEKGSASSDISANATSSDELVLRYSNGDYFSYIDSYILNQNMLLFQKENFLLLKELNIPYSSILVKVANPYYSFIKTRKAVKKTNQDESEKTAYEVFLPKIKTILEETNTQLHNMNEDREYSCNFFTDASHMSSECFPDYTDFIFKKIMKINKI